MIETDVKEFKIGVENELRKDKLFRDVIENLKEDSIKRDRKEILYYDCLTLIPF